MKIARVETAIAGYQVPVGIVVMAHPAHEAYHVSYISHGEIGEVKQKIAKDFESGKTDGELGPFSWRVYECRPGD